MKPAVTLAKLEPPRLPAVFERSRLFAVLDAAREKRLILVSGPPGAGKTTLIASYLRSCFKTLREVKGSYLPAIMGGSIQP